MMEELNTLLLTIEEQKNFSENVLLENFLRSNNKNSSSLKMIKEHLNLYLQKLNLSMSKLINQDYNIFIYLSTNIKEFIQLIDNLNKEFTRIEQDIIKLKFTLETNLNIINKYKIKQNNHLLRKKLNNQLKFYNLLKSFECENHEITETNLEKYVTEFILLKWNKKFCEDFLTSNDLSKYNEIESKLIKILNNYFIKNYLNLNKENLEKSLRMYVILNLCSEAENTFKTNIIHVKLNELFDNYNKNDIAMLYNKILEFIPKNMDLLMQLTYNANNKINGFNFLLNSYWLEIQQQLDNHVPVIFAPGNPELYFIKYQCTNDFFNKIEVILNSKENIKKFRNNSVIKLFDQPKLNTSVYYQICYQKIVIDLEKECIRTKEYFKNNLNKNANNMDLLSLISSFTIIKNIWITRINLRSLFSNFLKLTLHCLSRVLICTKSNLNEIDRSVNISNKIDLYIFVYDVNQKYLRNIQEINELIHKNIPKEIENHYKLIELCFNDINERYLNILEWLKEKLIHELHKESKKNINCNDILRLYRKTNREIPTSHSQYVENMLAPLNRLVHNGQDKIDKFAIEHILTNLSNLVTENYTKSISEVITSARKTEESLKRLKNLQNKSNRDLNSNENLTMSDDKKIRRQLQLDALYWTNNILKLVESDSCKSKLDILNRLVTEV